MLKVNKSLKAHKRSRLNITMYAIQSATNVKVGYYHVLFKVSPQCEGRLLPCTL